MAYDATLPVLSTMNVLGSGGVRNMKYFSFGGYTFSPIYLGGLADEIRFGYLSVEKTNLSYNYYSAGNDTIYLNFATADTIERQAMIVHEATHTMFDFQGKEYMTIAESESLAYIAQCMYVRMNGNYAEGYRLSRLDNFGVPTDNDAVFECGWNIAGKIIASTSAAQTVYKVSDQDVQDMKNAVAKNSNYKGKASHYTDFNGYM